MLVCNFARSRFRIDRDRPRFHAHARVYGRRQLVERADSCLFDRPDILREFIRCAADFCSRWPCRPSTGLPAVDAADLRPRLPFMPIEATEAEHGHPPTAGSTAVPLWVHSPRWSAVAAIVDRKLLAYINRSKWVKERHHDCARSVHVELPSM